MASGFRPRSAGYKEVLNGSDAFGACDRAGADIASRAGSGYTHDTRLGKTRIHTRVKAGGGAFWRDRKTPTLSRIAATYRLR